MFLNQDLNVRESEPKLWAKSLQKQKRKNHAKISVLVHFSICHFVSMFGTFLDFVSHNFVMGMSNIAN